MTWDPPRRLQDPMRSEPLSLEFEAPESPGRIQKVDPLDGAVIYTIGVLESRFGGVTWGPEDLRWLKTAFTR